MAIEYLPTDLPRYTKITSRAAVQSSVVSSGHVLIFAENTSTLTMKDTAGNYNVIGSGGSGGVDPSSTTATPDKVLSPYRFVGSNGVYSSGTIQTYPASTYTPTTSAQYIPAGVYMGGVQTIAGDANLVASNIAAGVTIFGVSGTKAGATTFYKCATVTPGGAFYRVSGAGSNDVNGDYFDNGTTQEGKPVFEFENTQTGVSYVIFWHDKWFIGEKGNPDSLLYRQTTAGNLPSDSSWETFFGTAPAPTVTQVSSQNADWSGYQAIQNEQTGAWSFAETVTSGLVYSAFIPVVGSVYDEHATIQATLYTEE